MSAPDDLVRFIAAADKALTIAAEAIAQQPIREESALTLCRKAERKLDLARYCAAQAKFDACVWSGANFGPSHYGLMDLGEQLSSALNRIEKKIRCPERRISVHAKLVEIAVELRGIETRARATVAIHRLKADALAKAIDARRALQVSGAMAS